VEFLQFAGDFAGTGGFPAARAPYDIKDHPIAVFAGKLRKNALFNRTELHG
jgi:hypothetical protein